MMKNGRAMVSRQKPMAMELAPVSDPKIPDVAPNTTAITVVIFAYLAMNPVLLCEFSM